MVVVVLLLLLLLLLLLVRVGVGRRVRVGVHAAVRTHHCRKETRDKGRMEEIKNEEKRKEKKREVCMGKKWSRTLQKRLSGSQGGQPKDRQPKT